MTLEQIRAAIRAALEQRATHESTITAVRAAIGDGQATEEQATQLREARSAIVTIDADLDQHQAQLREVEDEERRQANAAALRRELGQQHRDRPAGNAHVTGEERTYTRDKDARGAASFFRDAFAMRELGDMGAQERLQRHAQEARAEGELTQRALATGGLGGLVVPQYLVDMAATVIRTGRPTANAAQPLELPEQGMSIVIPRGTGGAAVASQATENTSVQNTDQTWADLTVPVVTIAGQQDVSRQSLERGTPGIDQLVYMDLAGAYHAELNRQVVNGSGASNQMLGILNTSGINAATAFAAAPTWELFHKKLAGLIAAIAAVGVGITPQLIDMNPRRWGWLTSLLDSEGRPYIPPNSAGPVNAGGLNLNPGGYGGDDERTVTVVGQLQGLPVTTDAGVPTNIGTNSEDVVVVGDFRHALLWEDGDGMPRQLRFEETKGNQLTVNLVVYGYAAFTAGRYPKAFGKIGGLDTTATQGLVAPTF